MKLSGTYTVGKWDETPYDVIEDRMKVTRASVEYAFSGDIEGTAKVEYQMFYKSFDDKDPHKAHAEYVCWRDGKVVPPSNRGQGRRKNQISGPKSDLPTAWWW